MTTTNHHKASPNAIAAAFLESCRTLGWRASLDRDVVTITTTFEPGDTDDYVTADCEAYAILSDLPRTGSGSTWGTTSDGVGGHVGLTKGYYELKVSGVNKRVLAALRNSPNV